MPRMKWEILCVWLALTAPLAAAEHRAADPSEVAAAVKQAQPGDVITLADGTYRSADLVFDAQGTAERPIVLRAATPGKVVLSGKSRLRIAGSYLVVEGFYFWNSFHPEGLIAFRRGPGQEANHCRVTQCAVVDCNRSGEEPASQWILMFGTHNRVDHCVIQGKTYGGPEVDIWIPADQSEPVFHQIDHNYFGPRPALDTSRSGEALRVGQGAPSVNTRILVEGNLFDRCAGGLDVVNNCASEVAFRQNTFLDSSGSLTLRACHRCLVTSNYFIGGVAANTGGVRVSGEDHNVTGNYFANLTGDGDLAAVSLMDGYTRKSNGYLQPKRCTINENILVQCNRATTIGATDRLIRRGGGDRVPPQDCTFAANIVVGSRGKLIDPQSAAERLVWRGNLYTGGELGVGATPDAWIVAPINLGQLHGLAWPQHPAVRGPQLPPLQSKDFGPSWFSIVQ
jgi:poly(beta-D-mannuronate) lyase